MNQTQPSNPFPLVRNVLNSTELVKDTVKRLHTRYRDLGEKVEALQGRLTEREQQQKLLGKHIGIRNTILAPINQLSPLVLRKIFQYCLPRHRNAAMCNKEAPVLLGQICHRWRQIALSTPELWTAIHISLTSTSWSRSGSNYVPRKSEALRLEAISSWLSRSGELPLSISIGTGETSPRINYEKIISPYLERLSKFSQRWRLIFFHLPHLDVIKNIFLRYKASDLPLLEKLHLDGTRCTTGKLTSARALGALAREDSFLYCPKLRWISLPLLGELFLEAPVRWSQLTVLNLNGSWSCPLFRIMGTIASCPGLESLSVCFDLSSPDADLSLEQTVTLLHLSSLCVIERFPSFDSPRFFNHLRAPNIQYLAYERYSRAPRLYDFANRVSLSPQLLTALNLFVSRAQRPIEELALNYDWLLEEDLYQFLSILPDLKRLQLQGTGKPVGTPSWLQQQDSLLLDDFLMKNLLTIPDKRDIVTVVSKDANILELNRSQEPPENTGGNAGLAVGTETRRPLGTMRKFEDSGEVWQETSNFFSPRLEVFQCTGAMFSVESFLKFLQSRAFSSKRFGISRLRTVDVSFAVWNAEAASEALDQIKELAEEVGMSVFFHLPASAPVDTPPLGPYSPHEGMFAVGFSFDDFLSFRAVF